jgi:hypothetical protein
MTLFDSAGILIYTLQVFSCSKVFILRYPLKWNILLPTILQNDSYSFFSSMFKCHFLRETFPHPSNSNLVCLQRSHCKHINNSRYCNFKLCIYLCDFWLMFVLHPGFNYFILTFFILIFGRYIIFINNFNIFIIITFYWIIIYKIKKCFWFVLLYIIKNNIHSINIINIRKLHISIK